MAIPDPLNQKRLLICKVAVSPLISTFYLVHWTLRLLLSQVEGGIMPKITAIVNILLGPRPQVYNIFQQTSEVDVEVSLRFKGQVSKRVGEIEKLYGHFIYLQSLLKIRDRCMEFLESRKTIHRVPQ
jgi:hypothetical protein